jgi:hypothetical protein
MEFTTPLPCTHLRPASITDHLELSTMIGTRAISGSAAIRFKNVVMARSESSMPSSMLTSITLAPLRTCSSATSTAAAKSPAFTRPANLADPVTLVRSPTMMKFESGRISRLSRPLQCAYGRGAGGRRGATSRTASAMARMCSGVVPQQPPTRLTSPLWANSRMSAAVSAGRSS